MGNQPESSMDPNGLIPTRMSPGGTQFETYRNIDPQAGGFGSDWGMYGGSAVDDDMAYSLMAFGNITTYIGKDAQDKFAEMTGQKGTNISTGSGIADAIGATSGTGDPSSLGHEMEHSPDPDPDPQQGTNGSKKPFPSFSEIEGNYPLPYDIRPDRTPVDRNRPVDDNTGDNFLYYNQCAIRVSVALRKSGVSLKGAKNHTNPGGNPYGNGNILGATNMAWFLRENYLGIPEIYNGTKEDVLKKVQGRQGIIYFQGIIESGRRSPTNVHIELWDKTHYMSNFDFNQMFDGDTIWFWPLK